MCTMCNMVDLSLISLGTRVFAPESQWECDVSILLLLSFHLIRFWYCYWCRTAAAAWVAWRMQNFSDSEPKNIWFLSFSSSTMTFRTRLTHTHHGQAIRHTVWRFWFINDAPLVRNETKLFSKIKRELIDWQWNCIKFRFDPIQIGVGPSSAYQSNQTNMFSTIYATYIELNKQLSQQINWNQRNYSVNNMEYSTWDHMASYQLSWKYEFLNWFSRASLTVWAESLVRYSISSSSLKQNLILNLSSDLVVCSCRTFAFWCPWKSR